MAWDIVQFHAARMSAEWDRQIEDERSPNPLEDRLAHGPALHLPTGTTILELHMRRTPTGVLVQVSELQRLPGGSALSPSQWHDCCSQGTGRGDRAAVGMALGGHEELLLDLGVLPEAALGEGDCPCQVGPKLIEVAIGE